MTILRIRNYTLGCEYTKRNEGSSSGSTPDDEVTQDDHPESCFWWLLLALTLANPGIFTYQGDFAVAQASDGSLIGPSNPAFAGEAIVLYTTALGPVTIQVPDGYGAPSNPLAWTIDPVDTRVAGESSRILFSGLTPGCIR